MWPGDRHVVCDCGVHMLTYGVDEDEPHDLHFSLWKHQEGTPTWRHRLRHIWRILRYGEPYADWFVLRRENAERFAYDLLKLARPGEWQSTANPCFVTTWTSTSEGAGAGDDDGR